MELSGIYAPIPTPFHADGTVDFEALARNVTMLNRSRLSGYVVFGSNGEAVFLNHQEKLDVLRAVVSAADAGKAIIAGTGCESTRETVALTNDAADIGAVAALVMNPHYYSLSTDDLEGYFQSVADAVRIPLIIYNVPKFTGVNIGPDLVSRLARHGNIIGLKDSSGNVTQMSLILRSSSESLSVLSGTANVLYAVCAIGGSGAISALANIAPDQLVQIVEWVATGQHAMARDLQLKLLPANIAVTATYGVPGLKAAMNMCGYAGGFPRSPLRALSPEDESILAGILREAGIL